MVCNWEWDEIQGQRWCQSRFYSHMQPLQDPLSWGKVSRCRRLLVATYPVMRPFSAANEIEKGKSKSDSRIVHNINFSMRWDVLQDSKSTDAGKLNIREDYLVTLS